MEKIAIMTCGTSGIDYLDGDFHILQGRTTIEMNGKEYLDGVTIHPDTFYDQLREVDEVPKTAQPSSSQLIEKYQQLADEGYTDVIYISISEHLSGTYQGVFATKTMVDFINIHPFNSLTACYMTGFYATEAYRMADEGKSVKEILGYLEKMRGHDKVCFMVDDLKYLVKNGRLSNRSAFLASMLKIKPVLELGDDGKIVGKEKIRTSKKAINHVVNRFLEETNNGKDLKYVFFFNTDAPKHLKYTKSLLEEKGFSTEGILDKPISPAIGCHVGPGLIGIGYVKDFE